MDSNEKMIKKTTRCKFCGYYPVEGKICHTSAPKGLNITSRVLGTIGHAWNGNFYSAWRSASGQTQDSIERVGANLVGGVAYSFHCPHCGGDFEKNVY